MISTEESDLFPDLCEETTLLELVELSEEFEEESTDIDKDASLEDESLEESELLKVSTRTVTTSRF